ncbi:dGTPase [Rheinheimera sp.]|uniref:dGTPase n=1 Tax=Rheinheimera sp. TaxID=1869214 RepID=UPI00307FC026
MDIDFRKKIKADRPLQSSKPAFPSYDITRLQFAFESDRGRIINSAAIRRLQQKTQVFPLERNAAVRSRLTHSMEVQQVGRFIVQSICRLLREKHQLPKENATDPYHFTELERATESLIEMACLMHDIGNPPFGHSGEAAINKWFACNLFRIKPKEAVNKSETAAHLWQMLALELQNYEGNAQGIRIVTSLQTMNLTYSQLACIMKYTRPAWLVVEEQHKDYSYLMKKPGYFHTEHSYIKQQNDLLGIAEFHRHPLSYIMEAADDISYCIADIEDAVEKGILGLDELKTALLEHFKAKCKVAVDSKLKGLGGNAVTFEQIVTSAWDKTQNLTDNRVYEFFISLRVGILHPLVCHAAEQFTTNIEQVFHGSFNRALLEDESQYHAVTETFKSVAREFVFNAREVELLEIQGFKIIGGLLDTYLPILRLSKDDFSRVLAGKANKDLPLENRLAGRLPGKYKSSYQKALQNSPYTLPHDNEVYERYLRCRLIQDHISGMTDHYALDEYEALVLCR